MPHSLRVAVALFVVILSAGCARSPELRAAQFMERGKAYLAAGDFQRAVLEFRNAVQRTPDAAEPYYLLGEAYLGAGSSTDAATAFRRACELNPRHFGAQLKLAEMMAAGGTDEMLRGAMAALESIVASSPENVEALDALALAEWRSGKPDDAARRLEQALDRFPASVHSAVALARLRISRRDLAGAEGVLKDVADRCPESADAALAAANLYILLDRPDDAERYFRRALSADPQSGTSLMGLAAVQIAGRRLADAEETLRRAAALPQKEYRSQHAMFLLRSGRRDRAVAEFEALARRDPADRGVRTQLVAAYMETNRIAEARALLSAALAENPRDIDALLQASELDLKAGRPAEAAVNLKQVLAFLPNSAEAHRAMAAVYRLQRMRQSERQELAEAVRLDADLLSARLELARSYLPGEPKNALQVLDEAPDPQKPLLAIAVERNWALLALGRAEDVRAALRETLKAMRPAELMVQDALARLMKRDYDGARLSAEEALKQRPDDVRAARVIADSYAAEKQFTKAGERLRAIAAARSGSAPMQHLLGQWEMSAGNLAAAKAAFERAKAAGGHEAEADFALAEIDVREGRREAAMTRLRKVIAADPDNVAALSRLAALEEEAGNISAAETHYRAVLAIDASNLFALNNLAAALTSASPDEALALASRAAERAPDNPSIQDTLGWIYYRKGIYSAALVHLKEAVAKDPTPRRKFHLAVAHLKSGDRAAGEKLLAKALQEDPSLAKSELTR